MARKKSTKRRTSLKKGFDTKVIIDIGLAGIATRILPMVVNKFMPLDPTLYAVVGAGGTYIVGNFMKKPLLANAGIALGLVEFVAPMVENLIGGFVGTSPAIPGVNVQSLPPMKQPQPKTTLTDYLSLNDYISTPDVRQGLDQYRSSY